MDTIELSAIEADITAGRRLSEEALRQVATLDVLMLGMLADQVRRRLHSGGATFVRVCERDVASGWTATAVPAAAGEVRLRQLGATLDDTVTSVRAARVAAGARVLSGFSLAELDPQSRAGWGPLAEILSALRAAGLDAVAEAPIDRLASDGAWVDAARRAGLVLPRVTVDRLLGPDRVARLLTIRALQDAGAGFRVVAPLPRTLSIASPTTGYDDVRAVALTRLALDNVPTVQVDWQLYGPKLAQVALTFGADDLDSVAADDDAARGWRRAPVEEVRRNIEAAGLSAIERDARFVTKS